jgi:transposase
MRCKSDQIRDAWTRGDRIGALRIAARFYDRSDDTLVFKRGMARMMRVGLYRPVHVKTLRSQKLRMLLTHRKLLQSKAIAIENDLRGTLRNFGLKVGTAGSMRFEARVEGARRRDAAYCPAGVARADRCSASPPADPCPGR